MLITTVNNRRVQPGSPYFLYNIVLTLSAIVIYINYNLFKLKFSDDGLNKTEKLSIHTK